MASAYAVLEMPGCEFQVTEPSAQAPVTREARTVVDLPTPLVEERNSFSVALSITAPAGIWRLRSNITRLRSRAGSRPPQYTSSDRVVPKLVPGWPVLMVASADALSVIVVASGAASGARGRAQGLVCGGG